MSVARNEVLQEDRADLMEIYMAVKGGDDGFNIVMVVVQLKKLMDQVLILLKLQNLIMMNLH